MLVRNISEDLKSEYSKRNWFSYWKHFKGDNNEFCSEVNCLSNAEYGALIEAKIGSEIGIFVIGLCECHGQNIDTLEHHTIELSPDAELVTTDRTL